LVNVAAPVPAEVNTVPPLIVTEPLRTPVVICTLAGVAVALPLASWSWTTGCCASCTPLVAVVEGCVVRASLVAAPGNRLSAFASTKPRFVPLKRSVYDVPAPSRGKAGERECRERRRAGGDYSCSPIRPRQRRLPLFAPVSAAVIVKPVCGEMLSDVSRSCTAGDPPTATPLVSVVRG